MKLKVRVNRTKPESMTRQITSQLSSLIETGVLAAGELLPSERTLADSLGVARNVVRRSYDYLISGGHVQSEGRKGRRVRTQSARRKGGAVSASVSTSKSSRKASSKSSAKGGKAKAASVTVRVGTRKRK
jgi:GntR family transcriptional regulator/MocR family aminotransferase